MNPLSSPWASAPETPRNVEAERAVTESRAGARGGEAESRHFCQGRHFCTGKRDRIEGIQFLTVGIDMDKIFGF